MRLLSAEFRLYAEASAGKAGVRSSAFAKAMVYRAEWARKTILRCGRVLADGHQIGAASRGGEGSRSDAERAFSLVEVMVAILVLGVAVAGLTRGLTTALSSAKESELQTTAALFAAGQIEELRAEGGLTDGTTEGNCGEGLEMYRWRETVSKTDTDGLHNVTVTIEKSQSGQEIYELRTLLFEPTEQSGDKAKRGGSRKGGSK